MKIQLVRNVTPPSRGTGKSAGIDFYLPFDMGDPSQPIAVPPGHSIFVPSGVKVRVPKGHALIAFNKSGVATKQKLMVGACVVDEDYTGEIHLHLTNVSDRPVGVTPGQKIVQFILLPVLYEDIEVVESLPDIDTDRGSGGFGSTGL